MATQLKTAQDSASRADAEVRSTVEAILAEVEVVMRFARHWP